MTGAGFDAVVVGAVGVDTNAYLHGEIDPSVEGHFVDIVDGIGQAGYYSTAVLQGLGLSTAVVGALGDDHLGALLRADLGRLGIPLVELRDPGGTHRSVNLVDRAGRRRNFFDGKRASEVALDPPAVEAALRDVRLVHVHLDDWCRHVLPLARKSGAVVSTDLQDVVDPGDPYRADFVRAADILFFSATNHPEPEPTARVLLDHGGARLAVAGMGDRGCLVVERGGPATRLAPVDHPEPVVDTNGAGDALAAGFLHAHLVLGLDPITAARHGQAAARVVCTRRGGSKRFPSAGEVASLAGG